MAVTTIPTITESTVAKSESTTALWRIGLKAGIVAAAATTAVAVVAAAIGVSFETAPGEAIPLLGFAQLTLVFTMVGVLIARTLRGRASHPYSTFVRTAVALTALSVVPDIAMSFDVASKLTLMLTHVIAATIVIPTLASRLSD